MHRPQFRSKMIFSRITLPKSSRSECAHAVAPAVLLVIMVAALPATPFHAGPIHVGSKSYLARQWY